MLWTATLSSENQIILAQSAYFDPNKCTLKFIAKIERSVIFQLLFLVRTQQCTVQKLKFCICFARENMKKNPQKYFNKIFAWQGPFPAEIEILDVMSEAPL